MRPGFTNTKSGGAGIPMMSFFANGYRAHLLPGRYWTTFQFCEAELRVLIAASRHISEGDEYCGPGENLETPIAAS
ncbi:hypothetical protein [Nocardia sp. NPDC006630]|uniref:hypothetical protein n=1 Tax=Nocardia sp. NPDC006630 TaxID=3157181 RepID=UPI0033A1DAAD